VLKFRKKNANLLPLEVDGTFLTTPYEIAEVSSKHFQFVHTNFCPGVFLHQSLYGCIIFSFHVRLTFKML
jgi:hypothetical protein